MASRAVIYGNVVAERDRDKLYTDYAEHQNCLIWQNDLASVDEGCSTVFVDLDDPRFSDPEFLVSLATAGEKIHMIGKSNQPSLEMSLSLSRLGVAEILDSEQCLRKLEQFLQNLEQPATSEPNSTGKRGIDAVIGRSPQICEIRKTIELLSTVDFPTALILGETGTGKSLISRILHNTGVRSDHNLVEVNCSTIPEELFESELFGHVKGAFTDARSEKTGLFEFADRGTLFLDEVGNLSASAQAKLLKILEDKKLRKVGSVDEKDISVRVVTATNANLEQSIADSRFREDLYYRINLLSIEIPPLRERPQDIIELVNYYLKYYATLYSKGALAMSETAMALMQEHRWPGNIRELCNVIERATLLSKKEVIAASEINAAIKRGRITAAERQQVIVDLPPQGKSLEDIQCHVVKYVLDMFGWNRSRVAKYLGISRPRLRRIIEAAGLEQDRRHR